ncbi:hypothetical protein ZIOFF_000837 [Zingiber officinale]|uniref:WRKY domain-containing protein n=1 Tax=Zingiber officinale TaxID=94328 RepID=A0A8J5IKK1_ZINOF|nr:hypothetical protein ZIOFF_000837 [Zingiber officinale]
MMEHGDVRLLLNLLLQGERQTRQLMEASAASSPSVNEESRARLQQIRSSLENAIAMAKLISRPEGTHRLISLPVAASDSPPPSNSGSPRSESPERVVKEHERREMCKNKKDLPKWKRQVRVTTDSGGLAEGLEDGCSWRKYGQKEILGAVHPRPAVTFTVKGYYRCTHRNTAGCLATKQVQRSDDDPCVFDITYRGQHTCLQMLQEPPIPAPDQLYDTGRPRHEQQKQTMAFSFSFPYDSTPITGPSTQNLILSSTTASENSGYMGSFPLPFTSPATSNFFPSHVVAPNASESELTGTVSAAASTVNSLNINPSFTLNRVEFDPVFPSDPSNFLG